MPFTEQGFLASINNNHQLSFKDIYEALWDVYEEHVKTGKNLVISANTQQVIYEKIPIILSGIWVNKINISQWIIISSYFKEIDCRNKFSYITQASHQGKKQPGYPGD